MKTFFSIIRLGVCLSVAVSVSSFPAMAQNYEQVAPKQPEKTGQGNVVNDTSAIVAGHGSATVLVDHLKGLVFLSDIHQVKPGGVKKSQSIDPGTVAFARRPDFAPVVEPFIGQPVTLKSLGELSRAIVAYYRERDRPVVNVFVPEQNITTGYVQVVVVESKVGQVSATGARYFSNDNLRHEMQLRPDEPISGNEIRGDLNWINRNPFRQSDILFSPGHEPGTTDVLLRTRDRFPLRVYAGYEDSGNQLTGDNRYLAGFNYGDLFGVGQQLSYQYTTGSNSNEFYAHSGTYVIPLPWHHELTFFGLYSEANANIAAPLTTSGVSWQASARYEIPLPGTHAFQHSVLGGFDFKQSNNDLEFGGTTISNVYTDVAQFVLGYQASYVDDFGNTSVSATGFWSPGDLTGTPANTDAAYMTTRAGATSSYTYGQFTLHRVTRLPWDFTWSVRALYQVSGANLLPSEELGLGGYQTVRGYDEREANGDNGFLLSTEVVTPPVSLGQMIGLKQATDQLQFLAFVDYGGTSLHHATPSDINPNANLLGIGPGVRYNISPYMSIRFDYGFQMIDTGFDTRHNSRGHIGVVVSY
jgi:hemolysin activation/secretion protein